MKDKGDHIVGKGYKNNRLYLLAARAILLGQERTNYASSQKLSWDQWHRRYGHISTKAPEQFNSEKLVRGLAIDQSSIPSNTCEACIQAKQAHWPFPQEVEHRSQMPGERIMSDVWGPAVKESIGRWKYYISFTDDCTRYGTVLFSHNKTEAADRIPERVAQIERQYGKMDALR